jgi:hypothetical protein
VAVPDTIQGVIMARIDRLPENLKAALQIASVIGREFTARLVERVAAAGQEAKQALGELRAVELIYEKATSPELEYMFKHALTHDVAYESLLRQRRKVLHRRAGEVIEELYADRLPEFYETLAWHYVHGETWPKAVDYLVKAADKARSRYAYPEATRFCAEAIEIQIDTEGLPTNRCGLSRGSRTLKASRGGLSPPTRRTTAPWRWPMSRLGGGSPTSAIAEARSFGPGPGSPTTSMEPANRRFCCWPPSSTA